MFLYQCNFYFYLHSNGTPKKSRPNLLDPYNMLYKLPSALEVSEVIRLMSVSLRLTDD